MHPLLVTRGFLLPIFLAFVGFLGVEFQAVAQTDPPCTSFAIVLETQMWGNEVSWNLVSTDGTVVTIGSATTNYSTVVDSACLAYGCYQLEMVDSFGDGWNGATWSISGPSPDGTGTTGVAGLTFTVGHFATQTVALGDAAACAGLVWGCTQPDAPNFNPAANVDDGSCLLPCNCEEEDAPVCAYDYTTGAYVTYPNACEALCVGAIIGWYGDCGEPPVYGCMDADALNYDASANVDDGQCVYMPTCGEGEVLTQFTSYATEPLGYGSLSWVLYGPMGNSVPSAAWQNADLQYVELHCLAPACHTVVAYGGWDFPVALEVTQGGGAPELFILAPGESVGQWALGIGGATDCVVYLPGCTDATALNYDPTATWDDGSCQFPIDCGGGLLTTFYLCTFSNGGDVALSIVGEDGQEVYGQTGFNNVAIVYEDLCLAPGCYTATMSNVGGGTGWYGGYWWLNLSGVQIVHTSLAADSVTQTVTFSIGAGGCDEAPVGGGQPFEFPEPIDFVAWPNPTSGEWVEFTGSGWDANLPVVVEIRDLTGRVQARREIPAGSEASQWRFDVSAWSAGMYVANVVQGDLQGFTRFLRSN